MVIIHCRGLDCSPDRDGIGRIGLAQYIKAEGVGCIWLGQGGPSVMIGKGTQSLHRLRGGGLIKKKSKAGHAVRKAKKRGLW